MKDFINKHKMGLRMTLSISLAVVLMVSFVGLSSSFFTANAADVSVSYKCHIQNIGWTGWVADDAQCGTTGQSLRMEAIQIKLNNAPEGMGVSYRAHVQNIGWQTPVTDGETAGTTGQALRMEALQVELTGSHPGLDIQYRAHVQNIGWQTPVTDGETAGTTGQSLQMEAINIKLVPDTLQLTIANPDLTLSKVYNGNVTAAVTPGALSGLVTGSENVTVSAVASYDTSAVGTDKDITVAYTLHGTDASKYVTPVDYVVHTGVITAKPITVTPTVSQSKVYGATDPTLTYNATPALLGSDAFTGALDREDGTAVGTYAISQGDLSAGANYDITFVPADFSITTKQLTIAAPNVTLSKPYDGGTTVATCTPGTLSGKVGNDVVTATCVATYATASVGTGKTINVVYTLHGTDAGNYAKPDDGLVSNGVITAVIIDTAAIPGVTAPVTGETPVATTTDTAQYTGTVEWAPTDNPFAGNQTYFAWVTITPKTGYTLNGVPANFFTVDGAVMASNEADTGVVTVLFPATVAADKTDLTSAIDAEYSDGAGRILSVYR